MKPQLEKVPKGVRQGNSFRPKQNRIAPYIATYDNLIELLNFGLPIS